MDICCYRAPCSCPCRARRRWPISCCSQPSVTHLRLSPWWCRTIEKYLAYRALLVRPRLTVVVAAVYVPGFSVAESASSRQNLEIDPDLRRCWPHMHPHPSTGWRELDVVIVSTNAFIAPVHLRFLAIPLGIGYSGHSGHRDSNTQLFSLLCC